MYILEPEVAITLPIEELAGHLLQSLKGSRSFHPHNVCCSIDTHYAQDRHKEEFKEAIMEAFGWLYSEGLIILDPGQSNAGWMRVSRRGRKLNSVTDITTLAQREILPKAFLHPVIAQHSSAIFHAGKYDSAVYEAFKQVEIAVKAATKLRTVGAALMKQAFACKTPVGPLTDVAADGSEQEGMMFVFAGAIQLFRNSTGHNNVTMDPYQAAALIIHASTLMYILDERTAALSAASTAAPATP